MGFAFCASFPLCSQGWKLVYRLSYLAWRSLLNCKASRVGVAHPAAHSIKEGAGWGTHWRMCSSCWLQCIEFPCSNPIQRNHRESCSTIFDFNGRRWRWQIDSQLCGFTASSGGREGLSKDAHELTRPLTPGHPSMPAPTSSPGPVPALKRVTHKVEILEM